LGKDAKVKALESGKELKATSSEGFTRRGMEVLTGIRKGIESQSTAELLTQLLGIPWNPETGIRKGIERLLKFLL